MAEQQWLNVGKIVNTHGVRGEVKVYPQTDFPDVRFRGGSRLLLVPPERGEPIGVEVLSAREQKNLFVVKLKGWDDINYAEKFKGWELKVTADERVELEEDEYYLSDIVGCSVVTDEGETIGVISDILSPGANDVWVVKRPKGADLLLPFIDEVVLDVDVAGRVVKVHLMEGLL
ncbi:ribosome maturation factor RimM [Cohnella nanjingensis]|uniref:ribosome maturation factor RimM n=1 Tax=Cohnella nanjingensis TaxID=1387779 RepID=UPI0028B0E63D|nr:ribosome maturation factor RimM [Cohnella nanjingensis]